MRYIGIIILLVLCLTLLLLTGCMINTVTPEIASGNLENQEDINQSSNNSQSSSAGPVEEPAEEPAEETKTVYPQKWATGDGTVDDPWANDCIQKALDFVPDGGTIFLKAGYYTLSDKVRISKKISVIGEGMGRTIIKAAAGTVDGFYIEVDYVSIKNLTIDGDAQTDGGGGAYPSAIRIVNCDYTLLEDVEVKNAGFYGIDIFQLNHSLFQNIHAHDNWRHGMHPGSQITGRNMYNTYRNIYCWNNGVDGFDDIGCTSNYDENLYNLYDNLQCWDNGASGIVIFSQRSGVISNSFAWGNANWGLSLWHLEDFNINNCSVTLNGAQGIFIRYSNNLNFTNVIVKNNNVSNGNSSGIIVRESNGTRFTSCQSYDDRATPLQRYGLSTEDSVDYVKLVNCKLLPNLKGAIYNPAGAAVTVITEKNVGQILAALSVVIVLCIFLVFSKICR